LGIPRSGAAWEDRGMVVVEIALGDITREQTDAIVNAANSSLLGGGGVDGAIHRAAGPTLLEECRRVRAERWPEGLPTGHAVATRGGALRAKWVIHTVGPVHSSSPDPAGELAACHVASLRVADEIGATSIAFPAISTGAYGYPLREAARVALEAVRGAATRVERVRFVLFGAEARETFAEALRLLESATSGAHPAVAPATRDSWKAQPLPEARARLPFARDFDGEQHGRIALGIVPKQMEDKWFIFLEDDWLLFHRSWTGVCVYAVRLRRAGPGSVVEEAWANRDPGQYAKTDEGYDVRMLSFLIDRLLLGRPVAFPLEGENRSDSVLRHHIVGNARANDED
jgi:O-acetyl-ADP-ribose deacetylase (regulator of RNase III)